MNFNATCSCGTFAIAGNRIMELIIDSIVAEQVYTNYTFIPNSADPYNEIAVDVGSDLW